jgi:uncharacterized membrane protein YhaH (DUF805 family)
MKYLVFGKIVMTFSESISTCFKKYVGFEGRASRSEYWWFVLFGALVHILSRTLVSSVLNLLFFVTYDLYAPVGEILSWIVFLGMVLPGLAVTVRRLHDNDRSGWWILLALIPLIGIIVLVFWYCQRGTAGQNRFGADPLAGDVGGVSLEQA